jgi:hypothetical protein
MNPDFFLARGPPPPLALPRARQQPRALLDLLRAFIAADVRFLVVGAYALALHGRPRATGDLDVWVEATPENAAHVIRAPAAFGAPLAAVSAAGFAREGVTYQLGVPPGRIDIFTELTGSPSRRPGPIACDVPSATWKSTSSGAPRLSATNARRVGPKISGTSKAWNDHRRWTALPSSSARTSVTRA